MNTKWFGVAPVLVVAIAVPVAVARHGGTHDVRVAPLSVEDRKMLAANASLVNSLPKALAEVPVAAGDASNGKYDADAARQVISSTPALAALSHALIDPSQTAAPLTGGLHDVLAGSAPSSADALPKALENLQLIEGEIVPAVRVVAISSGHHLSAAGALGAIESDRSTPELAAMVVQWQQIYGSVVLVEQEVSAAQTA